MEANRNNNTNNILRNSLALLAMLALGLLASCGGSSAMSEMDAQQDDSRSADLAVDTTAADAELERSASGSWYVATSDAAYIDGIDYLFQLKTDGSGHYQFVLKVTNNSSQPRHISYNSSQRADFSIVKNGHELYRWSENRFFGFVFETKTLSPYQTFEYKADWNGRDRHGNAISGNVMANGNHSSVSNPASLGQVAYLNGQVSW